MIGVKAGLASNPKENHEWLCIAAVDKNGKNTGRGFRQALTQDVYCGKQKWEPMDLIGK